MRFINFAYFTGKNWLFIIPTIVVTINDPVYGTDNIAIQLHWLAFHCGWLWVKER